MGINKKSATLKEDYSLRDTLLRKGLPVHAKLQKEINDIEQAIITSVVIPELEKKAQSLLADLRCEVHLSVTKNSEGVVSVSDEYHDIPKQEEPEQQQDVESDSDWLEEPAPSDEQPDSDAPSSIVHPTREGFEKYLDQLKYSDGSPYAKALISKLKQAIDNALVLKFLHDPFKMQDLFQMIDKRQAKKLKKAVSFEKSCAEMYQNHPSEMLKHYINYLSSLDAEPVIAEATPSKGGDDPRVIEITKDNTDQANKRNLRVRFADGTTFTGKNAKLVYINTMKKIGLKQIHKLNIRIIEDRFNIVDTNKRTDDNNNWQEQVDGYWIYTNMSNEQKVKYLLQIRDNLSVDMTIEAIEK